MFCCKQAGPSTAHDSAYNDALSAVTDFDTIVTGLDTILHKSTVPNMAVFANEIAYRDLAGGELVASEEAAAEKLRRRASSARLDLLAALLKQHLPDWTWRRPDGGGWERLP